MLHAPMRKDKIKKGDKNNNSSPEGKRAHEDDSYSPIMITGMHV